MVVLLFDGPILQKASSVHTIPRQSVQNLTVAVSSSPFVLGATGLITSHDGYDPNLYTPQFAQVMQAYNARDPISIPGLTDSGTTKLNVLAPGWDIQCQHGSSPYELMSFSEWFTWNEDRNSTYQGPPETQTMFESLIEFGGAFEESSSIITFSAFHKSTLGINGTLLWRNCTLQEAVIRYPLQITNAVVTLQPMPLSENRTEFLVDRKAELNGYGSK